MSVHVERRLVRNRDRVADDIGRKRHVRRNVQRRDGFRPADDRELPVGTQILKRGEPLCRHLLRAGGGRMHMIGYAVGLRGPSVRHVDDYHGGFDGVEFRRVHGYRGVECRDVVVLRRLAACDDLRIEDDHVRVQRSRRSDDPRMGVGDGGDNVRYRHVRGRGRTGIGVVVVSGVKKQNICNGRSLVFLILCSDVLRIVSAVALARIQRAVQRIEPCAFPYNFPCVRVEHVLKRDAVRREV